MQSEDHRAAKTPAVIPWRKGLPEVRPPSVPAKPQLNRQQTVAVAYCGEPAYDEIAEMVIDVLTNEGMDVLACQDGDAAALDRDVLLLMGSGRYFPRFAEIAPWRKRDRARTIVWHHQPLPPPVLTQRASDLGEKLLAGRWEDLLGGWASGLNHVLPSQGRVRGALQRLLALPVRHEFERFGGAEYGNVGWDDLCIIFEEAAWLTELWASPERWIDQVACSTPTRVAFLRQCGIPATFVPLGFHANWGELGKRERDIDVLFVGTLQSPGRRSLVPEVLRQLRDWGYRTCEVDAIPCGKQRTDLLQRARVMLNVLRFPWEFPGPRLFASSACGALCVSNEAVQNEPFQPGLHFIRAPRARMAESICWYLTNEEERRRLAAKALLSFRQDFPLVDNIAKLLSPARDSPTVLSRAA